MTIKQAYEIFFGPNDQISNEKSVKEKLTIKEIKKAYNTFSMAIHPDYCSKIGINVEDANLIFDEIHSAKEILLSCLTGKSHNQRLGYTPLKFDMLSQDQKQILRQRLEDKLKKEEDVEDEKIKIINRIRAHVIYLNEIKQIILNKEIGDKKSIYLSEIDTLLAKASKAFEINDIDIVSLQKLEKEISDDIDKFAFKKEVNDKDLNDLKQIEIDKYYEMLIKFYISRIRPSALIVTIEIDGLKEITEIYKHYQENMHDQNTINQTYNAMKKYYESFPLENVKVFNKEDNQVIKDRIIDDIYIILRSYNAHYQMRTGRLANVPVEFKIKGIMNMNSIYDDEQLMYKSIILRDCSIVDLYLLLDVACSVREEEMELSSLHINTH